MSPIVSGGGGGAGGLVSLFDSGFLGADAASIDTGANGVPATHGTLVIVGYLRSTVAGGNDNLNLTLNNDSSAIYSINRIQNVNTTLAGASFVTQTAGTAGTIPGATATANYFGAFWGTMPAYDGATNFKTGYFITNCNDNTAANSLSTTCAIGYGSATAISRLKLAAAGGNLKAGSRLIIYGTQ